jgi:hypothetical protein
MSSSLVNVWNISYKISPYKKNILKYYIEDHEDTDELSEAEGDPELEGGKRRHHGGSAFTAEQEQQQLDVSIRSQQRAEVWRLTW